MACGQGQLHGGCIRAICGFDPFTQLLLGLLFSSDFAEFVLYKFDLWVLSTKAKYGEKE